MMMSREAEDASMAVLLRPERWVWLYPGMRPAARAPHHPEHERWMRSHTHAHPYREVMMTLVGPHFYGMDGRLYPAAPGTVFLFDRGVPHDAWYSRWQPDCSDLWIHLGLARHASAEEVVCRGGRLVSHLNKASRLSRWYEAVHGPLVETVHDCWDAVSGGAAPQALYWLRLKAVLTTMILTVAPRRHDPAARLRTSDENAAKVVAHVRAYVEQHLANELSLTTLARLAGYAPHHFHRMFHAHSGVTLHRYVRQARIGCARRLLQAGQSVQAVGEQVGFRSACAFSRFFRDMVGVSPDRWRQTAPRTPPTP